MRAANARVVEASERDPELSGMGTTLTALAIGAGHVAIASVGDSRGYLVRDGAVRLLTHDDTWLASVLGRDGAREAAARAHPMRHVLTSIVGARDGSAPEVLSHDARAGDVFVLTTDGLHNVVDDDTIGRLATEGGLSRRRRGWSTRRCRGGPPTTPRPSSSGSNSGIAGRTVHSGDPS